MQLGELISRARVERCGSQQLPVLSMTMHDGIVRQRDRFKKAIASKDTSIYKVVYPQQLVVGFPIDEGVIYVQNFDEPGIMSPAYNVWDIDSSKVHPAYLELALHSPQTMAYYAVQMKGTTARRRTLSTDKLCDIKVVLPPLEKQLQIVKLFHQVRELQHVNNAREASLDSLVKSRFVEMFGDGDTLKRNWPKSLLSSCVESIESGKSPNCASEPRAGTNPGVLKLSALSSGVFEPAENKAMLAGESILPEKEVKPGDILVTRKNTPELVGSCVLVQSVEPNLMFPDIVFRMHPRPMTDGRYLSYLLGKSSFASEVRGLAHGSAKSMSNISKSSLEQLEIPLPPLALQREFANFAARVDKLRLWFSTPLPWSELLGFQPAGGDTV